MARTVEQISSLIKQQFVANITLANAYSLDQNKSFDEQFSSVSIEAIIIYIGSSAINLLELIMDKFSADVDNKISNSYLCSIPWYHAQALKFQYGHALEFNEQNYTFGYSVVDETAQIVKYVAVREIVDTITMLRVLVNKANHVPLTASELSNFEKYMKQIGAAGIHYDFVNNNPDELNITVQVIYNPLIINSSGQKITDSSYPVRDAIDDFIDGIKFGGTLNKNKLIDAIQAVDGVEDVILGTIQHKVAEGEFATVSGQNIISGSGSFIINTLTDTYTANI